MDNSSPIGSGAQYNPRRPTSQFTDDHHQIYNYLRQGLMQLHQQGVPGIDSVLKALNDSHVKMSAPQQDPVNPYRSQQPRGASY